MQKAWSSTTIYANNPDHHEYRSAVMLQKGRSNTPTSKILKRGQSGTLLFQIIWIIQNQDRLAQCEKDGPGKDFFLLQKWGRKLSEIHFKISIKFMKRFHTLSI